MIIAGIDMGVQNTKAVIMKDDKVIGKAIVSTGGIDRPAQAQKAYDEALRQAGVTAGEVEKVVATGKGKFDVPFATETHTVTTTAARAAQYFFPDATAVMSVGAEESIAAVLGGKSLIGEFVLNQKCAAGLGIFITYLARRLGMTIEQAAAADGADAGVMNDGCVVFAELDALSFMNSGAEPGAIMAVANKAVATRAATVLADLTAPVGDKVVLIGGFTKNPAFLKALEKTLNKKFLIPAEAEYAGAVGAAVCGIKGI